MSGIQINRITNANIYINGRSLLGRADEIDLPELSVILTDMKSLGMIGTVDMPAGFDKLSMKVKWSSFYADVWSMIANPFSAFALMARCSVETYTSQGRIAQVPLVTQVTASVKKLALGSFKPQSNADFPSEFTATYFRQTLAGADVVEIDYMANIFKVNGVDQLAAYNANIGA